jgi:hypothetical protein
MAFIPEIILKERLLVPDTEACGGKPSAIMESRFLRTVATRSWLKARRMKGMERAVEIVTAEVRDGA